MEVAAAMAMASEWPRELSGALTASLSRMYQAAGMMQGRVHIKERRTLTQD
jgi:hypothetical protein